MVNIKEKNTKVIDLFCGIGGLTHGLSNAGLNVVAGIDNDPMCKYAYVANNKSKFILRDIEEVNAGDLTELYGNARVRILVGCAPCQPYSGLNQKDPGIKEMQPLEKFAKLIAEVKPDIVSMENVRGLAKKDKYPIFSRFIKILQSNSYNVDYKIVNAADYGVPQNRYRLVLLASRLGDIRMIAPSNKKRLTVRDAIGHLPAIRDGEKNQQDSIHVASKLSEINRKRIKITPRNGGNSQSWPKHLKPICHLRKSGKTFRNTVYGRMRWDQPAPTMTTQCTGLGNGRFGHPEQNRAISLREAAIIQSFPMHYNFADKNDYNKGDLAKFIGNAVPIALANAIGISIAKHIKAHQ